MGIQKAVVLLSGGLDSATCLGLAVSRGYEVHALTVDYGSRHSRELDSARRLAEHYGVASHTIVRVGLDAIGGSALTDEAVELDTGKPLEAIGRDIPSSYVPARNIIFLGLAAALAEVKDARRIFIGANAVDYSGYPDCRPEFIEAFQEAVARGTKAGIEGNGPVIEAPLLRMSKAEIIALGMELGVPYELTWTCYAGQEKACGKCEACVLRLAGFREAGYDDPLDYADRGDAH